MWTPPTRGASGLLLLLLAVPASPALSGPDEGATKATMAGVLDAAAVLLPLSYEPDSFRDAANALVVRDSLAALSRHTDALADLGRSRDVGFAALATSIAREVRAAERDFLRGRTDVAQDRISVLTDHCVACHSRMGGVPDSALGARLLDRVDVASLELEQRARLETVTRKFTSALTTYEELLRKDDSKASGVLQLWTVTAYIVLAVRVVGDLERPKAVLAELSAVETLPEHVRADLRGWIDSLTELQARPLPTEAAAQLEEARFLSAEAGARTEFGIDRAGLIHYTRASALLHDYVDRNRASSTELSEAYYLLGVCESHTGRSSWLSSPEIYLEAAVRAAPAGPFAAKALSLLEWYALVEYTGSGGTHVPDDVQALLDELARLVRRGAVEAGH